MKKWQAFELFLQYYQNMNLSKPWKYLASPTTRLAQI